MTKKAKPARGILQEIGATFKRVESVVPDPHYPEKRREVKFTITLLGADKQKPIDPQDLTDLDAALARHHFPNRIDTVRRHLPTIIGCPEHDEAATLLRIAEDFWHQVQDQSLSWSQRNTAGDRAHDTLDRLFDKLREGRRRAYVIPIMARDAPRQAGTRKPRGSKMLQLDDWFDAALKGKPRATAKALWRELPTDTTRPVYRDGDRVCETRTDGRERSVGSAGFAARLTAAKKRRSAVKNRR